MNTLVTSIAIVSLLLAITPVSANNSQGKSSANGWAVFEPNVDLKAAKSEKARKKAKQKTVKK